jgi:transcriptional regulator with XRE-family HTH domain
MNNFKKFRVVNHFTQRELAELIGSAQPYICMIEKSNDDDAIIRYIDKYKMQLLCELYDCQPEDLVDEHLVKYYK